MQMNEERAIDLLRKDISYWENTDPLIETNHYRFAIKAIAALNMIDRRLTEVLQSDKRTFDNRETDDGMFFDGVYSAFKIVKEEINQIYSVNDEEN